MGENQNFSEKISLFLKGKLSLDEETKLLEKIKHDPDQKNRFLEEQSFFKQQVIQAKDLQLDLKWNLLKSKIEQEQADRLRAGQLKRIPLLQIPMLRIISIAAAFVFGLLISGIFYFSRYQEFSNSSQVQEISIPYGAKTKFNLPDGSLVWLNSGSKLSFPSKYKGKRTVQLDGEAYFDVVKSSHPFIVSTTYGKIQVLGTAFNVKAYPDDEFQTTLIRGAVKINSTNNNSVVLSPGQQAQLLKDSRLVVKKVNTEFFTSWKEGKLIFYREPFAKMARRMERWYNVNIEIDNEGMKDLWFTGTIEMETISEVMELISKTMNVNYSYSQDTRTLKIGKNK